ncbi:4'-phosphopantetheinyl transferase superfamily protein [Streptomyces sp. NPDC028635]|uniref:4'-phosphopantetheinyl transferase family protein n=1 Tax=Streptomyces sp. NPDC028635 TaxID=3154800 RepID=UPI0033F3D762
MSAATAGPDPGTVHLWFCPNEALDEATGDMLAEHWLDEQEHDVARRFVFPRDRRQYLVAHILVRRVLSLVTGVPEAEATIWRSARGRPFLQVPSGAPTRPSLDFNLSHTHGCNVVAVGHGRRVGVDIERLDRADERGLEWIVSSYAPEERAYLATLPPGRQRDRATLRLWTLKEAYAKARGLGLGLPFDSFSFELAEDRGVLGFRPPEGDTEGRWVFAELEPRPQVLVSLALEQGTGGTPAPSRLLVHDGFPWGRARPRELPLPQAHPDLPVPAGAGR